MDWIFIYKCRIWVLCCVGRLLQCPILLLSLSLIEISKRIHTVCIMLGFKGFELHDVLCTVLQLPCARVPLWWVQIQQCDAYLCPHFVMNFCFLSSFTCFMFFSVKGFYIISSYIVYSCAFSFITQVLFD